MRCAALPVLVFAVAFLTACRPTAAIRAVRKAPETGAIKSITTIHTAQVQYYSNYHRFATSLQELGPPSNGAEGPAAAGLIESDLASGEKGGYKYTVQATPNGYDITAVPTQHGITGSKTFFSNQGMKIHQHIGQEPATVNDPSIGE